MKLLRPILVLGLCCTGLGLACDATSPPETPVAEPEPAPEAGVRKDHNMRFKSISVGAFVCGIRHDDTVRCWGQRRNLERFPKRDEQYLAISQGQPFCGVRKDGEIHCWAGRGGSRMTPRSSPRPKDLENITLVAGEQGLCMIGQEREECMRWREHVKRCKHNEEDHVPSTICGRRSDGSVLCWSGREVPGRFRSVSSAGDLVCGVLELGQLRCWRGWSELPASKLPAGSFAQVDVSLDRVCALGVNGSVSCWSDQSHPWMRKGPFKMVATGAYGTCAIRMDDTVACWDRVRSDLWKRASHLEFRSGRKGVLAALTPPDGLQFVSGGEDGYCGLRGDGTPTCWGLYGQRLMVNIPKVPMTTLSVAYRYACGLTKGGRELCWGDFDQPASRRGNGPYKEVATASEVRCLISDSGQLHCLSRERRSLPKPERDSFVSVSVGDWGICAVTESGEARCWREGKVVAPLTGKYRVVRVGSDVCGIRQDGDVVCSGSGERNHAPRGAFRSLAMGYQHACGVRRDGTLVCWGDDSYGQSQPPSGKFVSVAAASNTSCALREDGSSTCWGLSDWISNRSTTHTSRAPFQALSSGWDHSCALRRDGTISCWGWLDDHSPEPLPGGSFQSLTSGREHTCALREDGSVACVGPPDQRTRPPGDAFVQISAGPTYTCGVNRDSRATCWGIGPTTVVGSPTRERLRSIARGGRAFACGLTLDHHAVCWGDFPGDALPRGRFSMLSAGRDHLCGLRLDNTAVCYGKNQWNQAGPPDDRFQSLSAGLFHTCGILLDGSIRCWGQDWYGQKRPPSGSFRALSVGETHTCALGQDDRITCWGSPLTTPLVEPLD